MRRQPAFFHTALGKISGGILLAAAIVTVLTWFGIGPAIETTSETPSPTESKVTAEPSMETAVGTPVQSVQVPARSTTPELTPGTCGDVRGGELAPKACTTQHAAEVIPDDHGCTVEDFTRYAGGDPRMDVVRADLSLQNVAEHCVVRVPDLLLQESLADLLAEDRGTVLRECHSGTSGDFVPCSETHTGEVVSREGPAQPAEPDCEARAEAYMNTTAQRVFKQLEVTAMTGPPHRCVVQVRGNNTLETSLRNLGSRAVKLGSGS